MTTQQVAVFVILFGTLGLFIWGRLRHDIVAAISLLAVVLTGLVPTDEAFSGFASNAVITVAAVLVISRVLQSSGLIELVGRRIKPFTGNYFTHIAALTAACTFCSAFMNNVGAIALFMPLAIESARATNRPVSLFLMPLAFGSLLGGMTTLIGTPPNIIVSDMRSRFGEDGFAMFDFTPVGLAVALTGIAFLTFFSRLLLPKNRRGVAPGGTFFEVGDYISELRVAEESPLAGKAVRDIPGVTEENVVVVGLQRDGAALASGRYLHLRAGDILIVETDAKQLQTLAKEFDLELVKGDRPHRVEDYDWQDIVHVEVVVAPGSILEGRRMRQMRYYLGRSAVVIGVARQGSPIRSRLREVRFKAGDVLLIQGDARVMERIAELGLMPLAEREVGLDFRRRVWLSLGIFAIAIAVSAAGIMPAAISFTAAVVAYVLLGLLPVRDLYRGIDWSVIVLLGAMFPLGMALESTGATDLVAEWMIWSTGGLPPWAVLAAVMIVTMTVSDIINNAATALIMAPLAWGIAEGLGVSPDAFLMAVAIGASSAFLTPIGHQSNTLVLGPGGYKFTDYWRLGLPLEILIVLVSVPLLVYVWPL